MANVLIVYGSTYGQTAKLVERLAARLRAHDHNVTLRRGDGPEARAPLNGFDGFLVAGSVHMGRHQGHLEELVGRNLERLNRSPSAFVSVCGALAGHWPSGEEEARRYVTRFLDRTGWRPIRGVSFAGAVPYTRYGFFTRWMMRFISWRTGRPTDTLRDWEFTDWDAVDRFADEFAALLPVPAVAATHAG
jgi:menaquinone-dependent protoporphyrinogen oxidase